MEDKGKIECINYKIKMLLGENKEICSTTHQKSLKNY